jgi:hypothetical protein
MMPNTPAVQPTLEWLTNIESELTQIETDSWLAYDNSVTDSPTEAPKRYLIYAKAHERVRTIQTAIIEILKKRIVISPPTKQDVDETAQLLDQLQKDITDIRKTTANLALFSNLFNIVNRRFTG